MHPVCPWCDQPLELNARKPGGVSRQRGRTRRQGKRTQRYDLEATPLVPQVPDLAHGETFKVETPLRAQSVESDVVVPVLQAVAIGGAVSCLSILPTVLVPELPLYTPFLVWPTTFGATLFVTSQAARRLLMRVEEWTGQDIDGDGLVGEPDKPAPIPVDFTKRQGTSKRTQHLEIPCPKVGEEKLAQWFWRICRQGGDGFAIVPAEHYDITRGEVSAIQQYFIGIEQAKRRGNWIRPNVEGLATMWGVVIRNYPDAPYPPAMLESNEDA